MGRRVLDPTLSDLFFNHEHPEFDGLELDDSNEDVRPDMEDAIREDASQFFDDFKEICNMYGCSTSHELAMDFMDRL